MDGRINSQIGRQTETKSLDRSMGGLSIQLCIILLQVGLWFNKWQCLLTLQIEQFKQ